jgi:hypothetical protein
LARRATGASLLNWALLPNPSVEGLLNELLAYASVNPLTQQIGVTAVIRTDFS